MRRRAYLQPGERFGAWTVVAFSHLDGTSDVYDCLCSCGRSAKVRKSHMRSGASSQCKSCAVTTHGQSRTDVFHIWQTMIARCHSPRATQYPRYGARGIRVCDRWRASFEAFAAAIGERPSPAHTLDRIDNARGYEPGNVRWATAVEQSTNRSSTRLIALDGETLSVAAWARRLGINNQTIHERLARGWEPRRALLTPTARKAQSQ